MSGKVLLLVAVVVLQAFVSQCAWAEANFKFAWTVPSRVTVTESVLKKGKKAKMQYDIVVQRHNTGNNLVVSFENYHFVELEGLDLKVDENRKRLVKTEALAGILPSLVISPQGNVVDVTGVNEMIDKGIDLFPAAKDPKARATMLASLRAPESVALLKANVQEFWQVWVETWADLSVAPGKEETYQLANPATGKPSGTTMTIRNLGQPKDAPGKVKLSAQTVLQGPAAKQLLAEVLNSFAPPDRSNPPVSPNLISNLKRTTALTVVTNPRTLQPDWAQSEVSTDCTIKGQQTNTLERHHYSFDWSAKPHSNPKETQDSPAQASPK